MTAVLLNGFILSFLPKYQFVAGKSVNTNIILYQVLTMSFLTAWAFLMTMFNDPG